MFSRCHLGLFAVLLAACVEPGSPVSEAPEGRPELTPTPALTAQPIPPEPVEIPSLVPVAVRHGSLNLISDGSSAVLVDADVWQLTSAGLIPPAASVDDRKVEVRSWSQSLEIADYIESPSGGAWLVTAQVHPRSGYVDSEVYRRVDARWVPVEIPSPEGVSSSYRSLLVRDGAVLGLWNHELDREAADDETLEDIELRHPLPHGFAKLDGPADVEIPRTPEGVELFEAVAGSDGTIYATQRALESTPGELFVWPPGQIEPERVTLPGGEIAIASLSVSGDDVWVGGRPWYLARHNDGEWTQVAIELADAASTNDNGYVLDAITAADGSLWAHVYADHRGQLLYRPPERETWVLVPLPEPSATIAPEVPSRWWYLDELGWMEAEVFDLSNNFAYLDALAWADGRVWIELSLGPVHDLDGDLFLENREVLYTIGELEQPVVLLPSPSDERVASLGQAKRRDLCSSVTWLVLGSGDQALTLDEGQLDALDELTTGSDERPWSAELFVAELDGRRALILQVGFEDPEHQARYQKAVAKLLGVTVKRDCRAWRAVEAVETFM